VGAHRHRIVSRATALTLAALAIAAAPACRKDTAPAGSAPGAGQAGPAAPPLPPGAVKVLVAYGSEKKTWLEEQIALFNGSGAKLPSGEPVVVVGKAMGSGEAVEEILAGRLRATVFSPASAVYVSLLNDRWLSAAGHTAPLAPGGDSIVLSPIVIAMWKPQAAVLGWPKQPLGWSDVIKITREPAGWGAHGRPEWGRFKLGHTHPEYSSSGLLTVLAEAYAGAGKTRGLAPADLAKKKTRGFVQDIEGAIVHYGKSTGFFAEKMRGRGPSYLSAAVLYENLVIESYGGAAAGGAPATDMPLVAIYPREGTFWADHPYCILADGAFASPAERKGAEMFLAYLKTRSAQERALALGFRPADPAVPVAAPLDAAHGVDPKQPQTLLEVPPVATMRALLDMWREVKKPSEVTLVFDKSGSMEGQPLREAKAGARAFLDNLTARDEASLVFFDNNIYPTIGPLAIGAGRAELAGRLDGAMAGGGTALYDAVARSFDATRERLRAEPDRIHALVVMTDGKDEGSQLTLEELRGRLPRGEEGAPVKIFTIAYGAAAQAGPLSAIADAGDGSYSKGTPENIVQVYRDIASFF
jgi:Ca-activated chloride channel family protein